MYKKKKSVLKKSLQNSSLLIFLHFASILYMASLTKSLGRHRIVVKWLKRSNKIFTKIWERLMKPKMGGKGPEISNSETSLAPQRDETAWGTKKVAVALGAWATERRLSYKNCSYGRNNNHQKTQSRSKEGEKPWPFSLPTFQSPTLDSSWPSQLEVVSSIKYTIFAQQTTEQITNRDGRDKDFASVPMLFLHCIIVTHTNLFNLWAHLSEKGTTYEIFSLMFMSSYKLALTWSTFSSRQLLCL